MLKSKKGISMLLAMVMVLSMGCVGVSAEEDLNVPTGLNIAPSDSDGNKVSAEEPVDTKSRGYQFIDIFNGTKNLSLNIDDNQTVKLGSDFTVSSSEPTSRLAYSSGTPSGINFSVYNVTRNTLVHWVPNVQPGYYSNIVYNDSVPNDKYQAKASANGSEGNASLQVVLPNTKTDAKTDTKTEELHP